MSRKPRPRHGVRPWLKRFRESGATISDALPELAHCLADASLGESDRQAPSDLAIARPHFPFGVAGEDRVWRWLQRFGESGDATPALPSDSSGAVFRLAQLLRKAGCNAVTLEDRTRARVFAAIAAYHAQSTADRDVLASALADAWDGHTHYADYVRPDAIRGRGTRSSASRGGRAKAEIIGVKNAKRNAAIRRCWESVKAKHPKWSSPQVASAVLKELDLDVVRKTVQRICEDL